jgi:hypothetical protein
MSTSYRKGALQIIAESTFHVEPGIFVYTKVSEVPAGEEHFLVTRDADEITVVTRIENLASLALIERNKDDYRLIAMNVSVPFYSLGFLATVSDAIASKGLNVLIVSTYSKDYLLIKAGAFEQAEQALIDLGCKKL